MKPVICITEKEYCKAKEIFKSFSEFDCIPTDLDENILSETIRKKHAFGVILGVDVYKDQLYESHRRVA